SPYLIYSFNTGGRYTPSTDAWAALPTVNAPSARVAHTAVWTGTEMIVWGGVDGYVTKTTDPPATYYYYTSNNTGGRYTP
ncbi:MAG TPA: hypothetical protein VF790_01790, partial [Dissulfurispiraceae bacterium]